VQRRLAPGDHARRPTCCSETTGQPPPRDVCVSVDSLRPQQSSLCGMDAEAGACEAGF
jgi:hypothetical protein